MNARLAALVGLLLAALALRAWGMGYGLSEPCLAPPEEVWLYEAAPATSLYEPTPGLPALRIMDGPDILRCAGWACWAARWPLRSHGRWPGGWPGAGRRRWR